jgi:outer membrane receptor for ferrienterochelin and colicin
MNKYLFYFLLVFHTSLYCQNIGSLTGTVIDSESGLPLEGATVTVDKSNFFAVTDQNGFFEIVDLPTTTYNITARFIGFKIQTKFNIIVKSAGNRSLDFVLSPMPDKLDEVILNESPFKTSIETPLSTQTFSAVEIETYPGGNNDITRVIQSLPGISPSVGGFRNDIIIRGGGPNETVYYIDGIEIPNINHFSTQGSSGGPVGLVNISFIKDVTLSTSSFGAEYDNALSGVLAFNQKDANKEKLVGNFRLGSSEAGLTIEGPINNKSSFILSLRRSYLQFIFKAFGFSFLPDYWDYQFKLNHEIDSNNSVKLIGIGSIDKLTVNEPDKFNFENQSVIEQIPLTNQNTETFGLTWRRIYKSMNGFFDLSISNNNLNNNFIRYKDNLTKSDPTYSNISRENETKLRFISNHNFNDLKFSFGFNLTSAKYTNNTKFNFYDIDYVTDLNLIKYGFFVKSSKLIFNQRLGVSFGFRFDQDNFTSDNNIFSNFSPRLSLSYSLSEDNNWKLNLSTGLYYKIPTYTALGFKDINDNFLNTNMLYTKSNHYVFGIEYNTSYSSRFTIESFYKKYNNYPISVLDNISLANKGADFEVLGNEFLLSNGKGKSYGLEFLYQQKLQNNFYGIFSYTFFFSEFSNLDNIYLPSVWDNRHLISFTGGYKLKKNWEISSKLRYTGNTPYAPVDTTSSSFSYPEIIFDYSQLGNYFLQSFTKLDFRVDKRWNFKSTSMNFYIDIENLLGNEIPIPPEYGLSRDDKQNIIMPIDLIEVESDNRNSVIPSLGFVFYF